MNEENGSNYKKLDEIIKSLEELIEIFKNSKQTVDLLKYAQNRFYVLQELINKGYSRRKNELGSDLNLILHETIRANFLSLNFDEIKVQKNNVRDWIKVLIDSGDTNPRVAEACYNIIFISEIIKFSILESNDSYLYNKIQIVEEKSHALSIQGENAKKIVEELEDLKNRSIEIFQEIENSKIDYSLSEFNTEYSLEAASQKKSKNWWIFFLVISNFLLLISIGYCFYFNFTQKNTNVFLLVNEAAFNLVLLSITVWCAKMYSLSRSLEINYKHKSLSSAALLPFINSVKEDQAIKETILLEASRMIFSPPETGLRKNSDKLNMKLLETIRDVSSVVKEK